MKNTLCRAALMSVLILMSGLAFGQWRAADLLLVELDAWRARTGFHQLAVRGNAPEDVESLELIVAKGDEHLATVLATASVESHAEKARRMEAVWQELAGRAMKNPLATEGYADFNAFSDLNTSTLELASMVKAQLDAATAGPRDDLLALAVRLQRISSEYLAITSFPSAGINAGTNEAPLDFIRETREFEQSLAGLQARYKADAEVAAALQRTATRWAFIRSAIPALDDPGISKVPLLFFRYSTQITDDLTAAAQAGS